jgi:hypothetical protein
VHIYYIATVFYAIQSFYEIQGEIGWFLVQFTGKIFKRRRRREGGRYLTPGADSGKMQKHAAYPA